MRILLCAGLAALIGGSAAGQTVESLPQFAGADVHPSRAVALPLLNGPLIAGSVYKLRFATMVDLIGIAYNVEASQVLGGPIWLELDRFDVIAKPPAGTTAETRRLMLRALLRDRFHLVARSQTGPMRVSLLRTGQRLQLKRADGSGPAAGWTGCDHLEPMGLSGPKGLTSLICWNITMPEFAEQVRKIERPWPFWSSLPVFDRTGLDGRWDFQFQYDPQLAAIDDNLYLSQILEKQVGLKLEDGSIPAPAVEIESVDRTPAPNPANLAKVIPPFPTEFEAAEIEPADTSPNAMRPLEFKNGRVSWPQAMLRNLIAMGWDVVVILGLPKWAESGLVDLTAKVPPEVSIDTSTASASFPPLDLELLRPMLRSLLTDRYKLQVHMEDRPRPVYTLLAVKPKLQRADPAARIACHDGPAADAPDSQAGAVLGRLVTCRNMTMAQFVEFLPQIAPYVFRERVVDATGIEGAWQFSLNFVSRWPIGAAADPAGSSSIFDAVSKQLGLKLELQERPMPALAVDRIENRMK